MIKPMKLPYEGTKTNPENTKAEIISLLKKFGIQDYQWSEELGQPRLIFKTEIMVEGKLKRWTVISTPTILARDKRVYDEETRRLVKRPIPMYAVSYRIYLNHLKDKLTQVALGASKFEEEFMADIAVMTEQGPKRLIEVVQAKGLLALPEAT
jgi:hypothetical protein